MKVFLIDNNRVNKYMLPSKIDDTFLITYNNGNKDILITLEGKNNEVYLKSNGTVDIIDNNEVVNESKLWQKFANENNLLTSIGSDFHKEDGLHPTIGLNDYKFENIDVKWLDKN